MIGIDNIQNEISQTKIKISEYEKILSASDRTSIEKARVIPLLAEARNKLCILEFDSEMNENFDAKYDS